MHGLVALGLMLLLEPELGDWRIITDDPGNAVLAVETSSITGSPSRRILTTVAASRETLESGRYVVARVAVDCLKQETTLVAADIKSLAGDVLGSLKPDDLESKTAPTSAGSPSAVALACDGVPVTTPSFRSDVEFITWAGGCLPNDAAA